MCESVTMVTALHDSTAERGDPCALLHRFQRDGYLYFRRLLPAGEVLDVRRHVLGALAVEGWLAEDSDPAEARPGEPARIEGDPNWWGGYRAVQSLEPFHRLAHHEALVELATVLLDDEVLVHPRKIARVGYPATGVPTPPHQDYALIQGAVDVVTMWLPFGPVTPRMGALQVLVGSHAGGLRPPVPAAGIGGIGVTVDEEGDDWASTSYEAGDVLVFSSLTVHRAPPNQADLLRLSADYRYQSAREPVVDGSLRPHMHPAIPDYDELTAGWTTTRWVEHPPGTTIAEVRIPDETMTAPPSRFRPAPT